MQKNEEAKIIAKLMIERTKTTDEKEIEQLNKEIKTHRENLYISRLEERFSMLEERHSENETEFQGGRKR